MPNSKNKIQTACCICQDYRDKRNPDKWYTPTPTERRTYHFEKGKISHTYCPTCAVLRFKEDGFSDSEIEQMVNEDKKTK